MDDLTKEEAAAVRALHRLAKKWPKSLWLFSAAGTLYVMKRDANGNRVTKPDVHWMGRGEHSSEVVDDKASVATINIPNDGGDF